MLFEGPSSGIGEAGRLGPSRRARAPDRSSFSPAACRRRTWRKRSRRCGRSASTSAAASRRSPGVKDPEKIHQFVRAARAAAARVCGEEDHESQRDATARAGSAAYPDAKGRYGAFGGRYVPETLVPALDRLQAGVDAHLHSPDSRRNSRDELQTWVGRPTALTYAPTLSRRWGAEVWLKREDLAHTGAHKINNARRPGAARASASARSASSPRPAPASTAWRAPRRRARLGLPCVVYMGAVDVERQAPNVGRMQLLGATVVPVTSGDRTLRAAIDEALRDWVSDPDGTYLPARLGRGSASLSLSGARAAVGDRPRSARADAGTRRRPARRRGRLRRRRIERHRLVPPVPRRSRRCGCSASRPAAAAPGSATTPRRSPSGLPACCRAATR